MQLVIGFAFVIVVVLVLLLVSSRQFDRLVRWEHDNRYDEWVRDGKPSGVLWRLPDSSFTGSYLAIRRVQFWWMFSTPPWAASDPASRRLLRRWRISALAIVIGLFAAVFAVVIASGSIIVAP